MIISKTPFRVSLSGGSTDYESFYSKYGSFLVGFSINEYVYIAARETPKIHGYHTLVQYSQVEKVDSNLDIQHNGVRGCLEYLNMREALEISSNSDLPKQTGVGTSSAFCVGLLHALRALIGEKNISAKSLADGAIKVERGILKEPGGIQDAIFSAYGGFNSVTINKDGSYIVRPCPVSEEFISEFENSIVLVYTGSSRNSFEVAAAHNNSQSEKYKHNILSLSYQMYDAVTHEDIFGIGDTLHKCWLEKKQIAKQISNDNVDRIYNIGIKEGAVGGKLLGSGVGGMMLFIIMPNEKDRLIETLRKNCFYCISPKIDFKGSRLLKDKNEGN